MPVSALLLRFVEDELSRSAALVERTVATTLAQLESPAKPNTTSSAGERQTQHETVELLQHGARLFAQTFIESLNRLVMADVHGLDSASSADGASVMDGLQLMDETRVEADIEISRASQLIDSVAEWELRELQTFTSALIGQSHVSAESNPLRPATYAQALWEATCATHRAPVQRSLLLRTAATTMAAQLKLAWAGASTRLESQGVEPSIYRTMVLPSGVPPAPSAASSATQQSFEQLLNRMPGTQGAGASQGDPGLTLRQLGPALTPSSVARNASSGTGLTAAFEQTLQQIEALLQSREAPNGLRVDATAIQGPAPLREHRAALLTHTHEVVERQIVELLSRIFEAVLSDTRLSAAVRAVMARLQVSALRVALVDRSMLEGHPHPVWMLMNRIAAASEVWPQPGDARTSRLLAFCESLAHEIASAPQQTASLYAKGLERLEAHLADELRQQQVLAQPTIDSLKATERREGLERELSHQLAEQIRSVQTTPRIRGFLVQSWARVVTESMLRFGDEDEQTAGYLKAVDDLLWSLRLPDHPQSRQRLLGLLPNLLKCLRSGMTLISMDESEQQAVLDELMAIHTEALRPGARANAREPTPQEIMQRLRDEVPAEETQAPGKGFADSLIDVFSMDTIPADLMSDVDPPGPGSKNPVDAMVTGWCCRWFLSGRWRRVQLLWRSDSQRFFVFAGETATRTHSITRQALERLTSEGLVKPLSESELIQRALDRVRSHLGETG
ncbi:MAG: DUF1631 family protein [Burkholderiaceae bacterium]|nr:DUF1631 family protein [Burkholderiaceae bacterium]